MNLVLIEHDGRSVADASLQALTFARQAAGDPESQLIAVLIGQAASDLTAELGRYGVARIVRIEAAEVGDYAPAAWARSLAQLMAEHSPQMILAAGTDRGNEVLAHLAAMSDLPLATNCAAVDPGDPSRVTRLRWGSSLLEDAMLSASPRLVTLALHTTEAEEIPAPVQPSVASFSPRLEEGDLRARLSRRQTEAVEGVTLKNAPVVVGGGRGVGKQEDYAMLEELAGLLGGAVGCTRVATNNGWRPHSEQVGLTGTRIAPALYIACGISGAIQHLVGCKGSKQIMVINKDPEAAFFSKADYGIVGDLHEIVPAIVDELKRRTT